MLRHCPGGLAVSSAAVAGLCSADSLRGGFRFCPKKRSQRQGISSLAPLQRSLSSTSTSSTSTTSSLSALSSRDAPAPPPLDFRPDSLTGRWHKLKAESDDMRAACDAVELNAVLRMGVGLVNTLEIEDERQGLGDSGGHYFATTLKAGGILDVKERYPWSGSEVEHFCLPS